MREKLNNLLDLQRQSILIKEKLMTIDSKLQSPKIQVITGLPSGKGGGADIISDLIEKKQKLESKLNGLRKQQCEEFSAISAELKEKRFKDSIIELVKQRFLLSKPWNECACILAKKYPTEKWNVNKCFNLYRKISK